jgi:hypothetical protein
VCRGRVVENIVLDSRVLSRGGHSERVFLTLLVLLLGMGGRGT